jgi:hypothetical protein
VRDAAACDALPTLAGKCRPRYSDVLRSTTIITDRVSLLLVDIGVGLWIDSNGLPRMQSMKFTPMLGFEPYG